MMMKRIWGVVLFMAVWVLPAISQDKGIQFVEDKSWQEILNLASEKNKLIFLDCYTSWCGPCKAMAKDVFPQPQVGEFMNAHFVNVKLDMEKGEGIELNKKYKKFIPGYPTYLLINSKGEVVHQVAGYNDAEKFIAKINDGLLQKSWVAYSQRYNAGERGWEFLKDYLQALEDAFQKAEVKKVVEEALPKLTVQTITENEAAFRIFRKYWTNAESPVLVTYLSSPSIYRKYKDPEKEVNEWGGRLFRNAVDKYVRGSITPESYDMNASQELLKNLNNLHVQGRENLIALLRLSQAVAANKSDEYIKILTSAKEFGMLRYDSRAISTWSKYLASKTTDKTLLKQYLAAAAFDENDNLISHEDIRNYAFILERMGEKEKAASYIKLADKKEAEAKAKLESLLKGL